jgi:hypothetical protein
MDSQARTSDPGLVKSREMTGIGARKKHCRGAGKRGKDDRNHIGLVGNPLPLTASRFRLREKVVCFKAKVQRAYRQILLLMFRPSSRENFDFAEK